MITRRTSPPTPDAVGFANHTRIEGVAGFVLAILTCLVSLAGTLDCAAASALGANKFDLALDYTAPNPPPGADPAGYARVRRAMGQKAILDARDTGLSFFRAAITGYSPSGFDAKHHDLSLWLDDPAAYWADLDAMFADMDAAGLRLVPSFVWNIAQFPAIAGDDIATFVHDPNSKSRQVLTRYLRDFIGRYKDRKTILFYEMGNEMNLLADLDARKECKADPCIAGNFTTAEMTRFARDVVGVIKSLDPGRAVSSGYSLPRPGASHLQARPQFAPGGPDWTPDTVQEFDHDLLAVNEPFDMVSIHFYAPDEARPSGPYGANFDPMIEAAKVVHAVGKRLFIGEFGDIEGATPFMHRLLLSDILHAKVDFAAIWVWEFYQTSTYETLNTEPTRFDIEPAYAERTIQLLKRSANLLGKRIWLGSQSTLRVILTWPLPCAKVTGVTKLSAVASDGTRPVKRIEFFVNNDFAGSSSNSPYSLSSDLSRAIALGSGFIKIEARAIASSGATRSFASFLEVSDGSSGPKVK